MFDSDFVTKPDNQVVGFDVATLLNKRLVKGEIGLEIECEGNKFMKEGLPAPWSYKHDGSLRGEDNAEYVLSKPIDFLQVPKALSVLWDQILTPYGTVLDTSNRTSVHVHLNVQTFHLNRLASFFGLYFVVEELLTQWCGEHRVGNLFCLRAKDATAIIFKLKKFLQDDTGTFKFNEGTHYSGLNALALSKFGSLEIRTLRGVSDPQIILDWVSLLERLYKLSADYPDPRTIPPLFSSEGPLAFLEIILGDKTALVRNGINFTNEQVRDSMYEGVRLAQDLCYCRDWSLYKPTELKQDPFGRSAKSKMAELMQEYSAIPQFVAQSIPTGPFTPGWAPVLATEEDMITGDYEPEYD